jgi:hypothetical protein
MTPLTTKAAEIRAGLVADEFDPPETMSPQDTARDLIERFRSADCPFCGHDPYHYVDNGVGMERVAVTCCDLGIALFQDGDEQLARASGERHEAANALSDLLALIAQQTASIVAVTKERDELRDFGGSAVETAGRILEFLGIGQDASKEPGTDRRRDRLAAWIDKAAEARATAAEAERDRLARTIGHRDRRIARLVEAMEFARSKGVVFPADSEPPVVLSDAARAALSTAKERAE